MKNKFPTTVAGFQAALQDQAFIGKLTADEELVAFFEAYGAEQGKERDEVNEQLTTQMTNVVTETLRSMGVERPAIGSGALQNAAYNRQAPGAALDEVGFKNIGEFARTMFWARMEGDPRRAKVQAVQNAYSSLDPSSGGFLIPEQTRSDIMKLALENSVVRSRATVITMDSLETSIPYVDSTTNQGSVFGGLIFYWTPESGTIGTSSAKFGRVKLKAKKLVGGARIPNELFADGAGFSSFLQAAVPSGLAFFEDLAFLSGVGGSEPIGALSASNPARIVVAKKTNQPNDTIKTGNLLEMYSRMLPSSLSRAVWVVNQTTFEQLNTLTIDVGTGGSSVALMNIKDGPLPTILTRPVIISEKVPALGDEGDINFVDFGYYLIGDRQAVSMDFSATGAGFMDDETEMRIIERVDGRPWLQSAIQPVHGDTLSPFVSLGAR